MVFNKTHGSIAMRWQQCGPEMCYRKEARVFKSHEQRISAEGARSTVGHEGTPVIKCVIAADVRS